MGHAFGTLDELGEGYGFRKIRKPLGVTAFGVNAIVYPPGYEGFFHYHDTQDELYFVHAGEARVEVDGEERVRIRLEGDIHENCDLLVKFELMVEVDHQRGILVLEPFTGYGFG